MLVNYLISVWVVLVKVCDACELEALREGNKGEKTTDYHFRVKQRVVGGVAPAAHSADHRLRCDERV